MKILLFILTFFVGLTIQVQAQSEILSENFNAYNAKDSTVPSGWVFSAHGNYTSVSFSGSSGPNSYSFTKDSGFIVTPYFSKADTISFWIKATSTISVLNRLILLGTSGNNGWDTIADIDSLPKSGKTVSFPLNTNHTKVCFIFRKISGNLALDDVALKANTATQITPVSKKKVLFALENAALQISTFPENESTDLFMFAGNGQLILRRQMQGNWSIDLSTLGTGLYIAEARIGEKRFSKKIVIRK